MSWIRWHSAFEAVLWAAEIMRDHLPRLGEDHRQCLANCGRAVWNAIRHEASPQRALRMAMRSLNDLESKPHWGCEIRVSRCTLLACTGHAPQLEGYNSRNECRAGNQSSASHLTKRCMDDSDAYHGPHSRAWILLHNTYAVHATGTSLVLDTSLQNPDKLFNMVRYVPTASGRAA